MNNLNKIGAVAIALVCFSCTETTEISEETSETVLTETEEITDNVEFDSELEPVVIEDLENEEFASKMNEIEGILIDVRTADEFNEGHIEGALNLDYNSGAFEAYVDSMDVGVPVFVYCQAGGRSGMARDILKDRDFLEVYNLKNGYGNWED